MNTALENNKNKTEPKASGKASEPLRVCFVCTGNTCRSPMAAALLNDMGRVPEVCSMCDPNKLNARSIKATSAGIFPENGELISANAVQALKDACVMPQPDNNYPNHRARPVDMTDFVNCDMVIGISSSHAMALINEYPQFASKVTCLPEDIPDPYGMSIEVYRECLAKIRACLEVMFFGA